jgi:valine dehydrogenase (NAD+)
MQVTATTPRKATPMDGPFSQLRGHEQVVYGSDEDTGLRCIIAIHSTRLGPALGGTRFHPYPTEADALTDVLRLSRAMAYKAAAAGLDFGGGKAVIIGDPDIDKSEALLRAYGRMVASLGGRYVTACDVGTSPADLGVVRRETRWATGAALAEGGSGDSGVLTAHGTHVGMSACAEMVWGTSDLSGRHVAIQGVGKVGMRLAEALHAEGAKLTVADVDLVAVEHCAEEFGADVARIDEIHAVDADIFSPNALGGGLNDTTIPQLRCRLVAGAANNQLGRAEHGEALADAGVLYAPDYVLNAGGLIQVSGELHEGGYRESRARSRVEQIGDRLRHIIATARTEGMTTTQAADLVAEARMAAIGGLRTFWLAP